MTSNGDNKTFYVKNCSLASIATGEHANSLVELKEKLVQIDEGCLYHHFWGGKLNPQFVHPQYHNDFASWVYHRLHDQTTAERLSIIDPMAFCSLELLRKELIDKVTARLLEENEEPFLKVKKADSFHFIRSSIYIFESAITFQKPEELPEVLKSMPPSSIFYHFIDARARTAEKHDDFSIWLKGFGEKYQGLIEKLQSVDPYFVSLAQLRDELAKLSYTYFYGRGNG